MTRSDAIKVLSSLPSATHVRLVQPAPDERVVVLDCDRRLTPAERTFVADALQRVWPDRQIVILDPNMRLTFAK